MNSFDVYFLGKIMQGQDIQDVKDKISKRFKVEGRKLEHMFSGNPVRIKTAIDVTRAGEFREIFRDAGALVNIVPTGQKVVAMTPTVSKTVKPVESVATFGEKPVESVATFGAKPAESETSLPELLPARTGSLIDCAPKVKVTAVPNTSAFDVSLPGEPLAEEKPTPAFSVDISHIEVLPANTGSLEEFAEDLPELVIPDISHLHTQAADGRNLVENSSEQQSQPLSDMGYRQGTLTNSDPFQDSTEYSEPATIADLSELKLQDDA